MYGDPAPNDSTGFYTLPFAMDGGSDGLSPWKWSDLTPDWMDFCRKILDALGPQFNETLPAPFDRVGIRFISSRGAGFATFVFDDQVFSTSALLRGEDPEAEEELLASFVFAAQQLQKHRGYPPSSFAEVFETTERPLHVVVVWTGKRTPGYEMVPELGNHFAGAFLSGTK